MAAGRAEGRRGGRGRGEGELGHSHRAGRGLVCRVGGRQKSALGTALTPCWAVFLKVFSFSLTAEELCTVCALGTVLNIAVIL